MFNPFKRKPRYTTEQIAAAYQNAQTSVGVVNSGAALGWKALFGNTHPRDLRNDRNQMVLSAIYCAVNTYVGAITSLPRFCQKIDPVTQDPQRFVKTTEHPASRIWSHYANDEMSSDDLLKQIVYDVLYQDGNYYALPERDSQGRVSRCYYIDPSRIPRGNIYRSEGKELLSNGRKTHKGQLVYKVISSPTRESENPTAYLLTRDEIIHIKGNIPDPENYRAQGILENNARSAGLYDASEEMGSKFYSRGYLNQMFLGTDHKLTLPVKQQIEEAINNSTTGGSAIEDIFKTRILEHGLKPMHVGMPLEAMKFIETRAFSVEDVARWFNMPAFLLHSMMGIGAPPEDSDKLMVIWIQNGLGSFMSNIANQFRNEFLQRSVQPLFRFEYKRLHLYKTVLNEFSQALRNIFEIGGINRLNLAELLGIHLDPEDATNTQRYVPANLLTVDHSLALEKKVNVSITQMEEAIKDQVQTREIAKDVHENPPEPVVEPGVPGDEGLGQTDPGKDNDEANQDKKTRAVPSKNALPEDVAKEHMVIVRNALWNTLHGLHEYEMRVIGQKRKSRPDDLTDALNEWYPKFQETLNAKLEPWKPVFAELGIDFDDTINHWVSFDDETESTYSNEQQAIYFFNNSFSFLKDK